MISFMYSHSDYDPFLGLVEVTGSEVKRGAGCGLEIPCINRLYGPKPYTDSTKTANPRRFRALLRGREALRKRTKSVTESTRKKTEARTAAVVAERLVARYLTIPGSLLPTVRLTREGPVSGNSAQKPRPLSGALL